MFNRQMQTSDRHSSIRIIWINVKNASSVFAHDAHFVGICLSDIFDNHFPEDSSDLVGPGSNHRM